MTIEELYQIYLKHPVICTDTRKITKNCIFFALKGDNFDGNAFAGQALSAGAAFAVVDDQNLEVNDKFLWFNSSLKTLQELAAHHRRQLTIPFIGITGTNGKTTSKELIKSVLSTRYKTFATLGNLNNHIGVPLTLLAIDSSIEMAIIEMGANHQKEIGFLSEIAQPTHGLITNVGKAHLEGFGGFEGVKKGKGELYDYLAGNHRIAFVNKDNHHLLEMSTARNLEEVVYYGSSEDCLVSGNIKNNNPFLSVEWTGNNASFIVGTSLTGSYNLENILAAIAVGSYFGLTPAEINEGISAYVPGNNRSQITHTSSNTIICDFYNANPSSMSVALDNFASLDARNKVIILGDMFELGEEAAEEHLAILKKAAAIKAEKIFIGKEFFSQQAQTEARFFESTGDALAELRRSHYTGATILIKGSRSMKLEHLLEAL